jgi:hypothetical protein
LRCWRARSAFAEDGELSAALDDYANGNVEDGLAKLRAYAEKSPAPEEILASLRGIDDERLVKAMSLRGEHERLLKYLIRTPRPSSTR